MKFYLKTANQNKRLPVDVCFRRIFNQSILVDFKKLKKQVSSLRSQHFISTPLEKLFWQKASDEMRVNLKISYFLRKRGVKANMEIGNWLEHEFFSKSWQDLKNQCSWSQLCNFNKFLKAKVRTQGQHLDSIRFDRVHLTKDKISGQIKHCLHWDTSAPTWRPLTWVKHFFKDQVGSSKS